MQQYKLDPAQFAKLKKKTIARVIPLYAIVLIVLTATQAYDFKKEEFDFFPLLFIIPVFSGIVAFSLYRHFARQKKMYSSYSITINDNLVTREQLNTPAISIYANDITSIKKIVGNYLVIRGKTPQDIIYVPPQLENYEEAERKLEEFMLIVPATKKTFVQRYQWLLTILMLAAMITSIASTGIIVAALCGIPVIALLLYGFFQGIKSKNIDSRTKRGLWTFWILIIVLTVNIIMKIPNFQEYWK